MATVYILYSTSIDGYYTGSCLDLTVRLEEHLNNTYANAHTGRASDWQLYLRIDALEYGQARKIESHIKSMKSRNYIENLKKYPELVIGLVTRYDAGSSR
ncbi:GIY-YIG nuclease family protein [Aequorivita marina]|uniref:GIY-YIG nuclease family protein n=1 Tax=Aequorivita marina TaxID=3073654 RepID=UPI002874155F|nr:GIY-YIG nuclease family protein [Aequorivita sp. S2608]MDS1297169.1 GIY-YIG nuclease family protein [Aequorivita sp. S2608]